MIGARLAIAVAVVLGTAGVILGVAAFMLAVTEEEDGRGRLVQTRLTNSYEGEPVLFALDDFYFARGDDGVMRALYVYPPGFYGHVRGCRVVWLDDDPEATDDAGRFVDPCGAARFSPSGDLISGPADRGLDYFETSPGIEGIVVDTRMLLCGAPFETPAPRPTETPAPSPTAPAPPSPPAPRTPGASPAGAAAASSTPTATSTRTPATGQTVERALTRTATAEPVECDRVSADQKD